MKKLILIILLLPILSHAQEYKFAWISDIHTGYPTAETDLDSVVGLINSFDDLKFLIASGDIAEKGKVSELEKAKSIFDKLKIPYHIIPGNHDTKWSETGTVGFSDVFGDDKFSFIQNNTLFLGVNTGVPMRGGGGHFKPEDLEWLKSNINKNDSYDEIFVTVHHPPDSSIDNWFELNNILYDKKYSFIFTGHGHNNEIHNFNGIKGATGRSTLRQNKNSYGFTIVHNTPDSLLFYEVGKDTIPELWASIKKIDTAKIEYVDSAKFFVSDSVELLWKTNLNSTLSAPLLTWEDKIYSADLSGILSCFDSTGNILWDYDAFGNVISRPAIADEIVAVGNVRGDLTTLDAETGEQILSIGFDDAITSQLITIDYKGTKQLMMPKNTNSNAAVVIGTSSGNIYCYDLETLQELWTNKSAKGMIETRPLYIEDKIIFGSWDGYLYCIDARNGTLLWKWTENENFYYSPAAVVPQTDGKYIFISTPDKFVSAVDLLLGKTVWRKDMQGWESLGISNDSSKIFVKGVKDNFYIVSPKDGKIISKTGINFGLDTMPSEPIEIDNKILFGGKNGYIYSINENGNHAPIIFTGTSRVHSIQKFGEEKLAASNMNGTIIVFKMK